MKHYLLTYVLSADYLDRRAALREEHLALAWAAAGRGELLLGGALDAADRALLVFMGDDPSVAEAFAAADPYVTNGLVTAWRVERWNTVAGPAAAAPLHPA